jgi:hypothetical protein
MTTSAQDDPLQSLVAELLAGPGALRVEVPVLGRSDARGAEKQLEKAAAAAAAIKSGLAIEVMPILPLRVTQGAPFVFVEAGELRVRICETPQVNPFTADAYALMRDVMTALHWRPREDEPDSPLRALLSHPLQLRGNPVEFIDDPRTRIIDVIFEATYALPKN